ncbi:MAG: hypothetical protein J7M39_15050 [Anaerolineae bacterium]|nr:hypothetical protein [Anaerolineae bacterium]
MKTTRWLAMVGLATIALLMSSCSVDIDRNRDGSLSVTGRMSAESLQDEITAAIKDPLVEELSVELRDSYILVSGDRRRTTGDEIDALHFRLDLGVEDGRLAVAVSDAEIYNRPTDEGRVALLNKRLANNLTRAAQRHPNSTLTSVQITRGGVVMTWHVESARSLGSNRAD